MQELERELGRTPNSEELAEYLEVTVEEVEQMISQANLSSLISLDEYLEQGSDVHTEPSGRPRFDQPEQVVDRQETKRILAEAIDKLTEKEQKVIALYYFEELTLKEISNVLEVSESRVSQLHTKALKKMKERLGDQIDLFGIGNI
jgi:RNA polymerase sigma factor for flagellar operon FliA